jgi:TPR repeat protein
VRLYKLAADQGNAIGQLYLGEMYIYGRGGLAQDQAEAVRLYKLAADQGYADAQVFLGILYLGSSWNRVG